MTKYDIMSNIFGYKGQQAAPKPVEMPDYSTPPPVVPPPPPPERSIVPQNVSARVQAGVWAPKPAPNAPQQPGKAGFVETMKGTGWGQV